MKIKRIWLIQITIFISLLFILNCVSWLVLNLSKHATFIDEERWDNSESFKSSSYAKDLYDENQKFKSIYVPFSIWKQTKYSGKYIKTNFDGERNFKIDKSINNKNVRLFGGSTMWGVGASDDSTIATFLSKLNPKFSIYNHGMQGFNNRQSLDRLITLYSQGKSSNIVIFYDGVNEISMCSKTISIPGHFQEDLFREKLTNRNTKLTPWDITFSGISDILWNSNLELTQKINKKLFVRKKIEACTMGFICDCDTKRTLELAKIVVSNWEMAKTIVEKNGGKFYAILQPVFSEGSPNIEYLDVKNKPYLINYKNNYSAIYTQIRNEIKLRKLDYVFDLTKTLNGKEPIFIDFCHINSIGNQKIAIKIDEILRNTSKNKILLNSI